MTETIRGVQTNLFQTDTTFDAKRLTSSRLSSRSILSLPRSGWRA
jgi:hypothetical protein